MKRKLVVLLFLFCSLVFAQTVSGKTERELSGFSVDGVRLMDANGDAFVIRGVNVSHLWFPEKTKETLKTAASWGCNTVRLVLGNGEQWDRTSAGELKQLLNWCERYGLVAIVELHDITGYGDKPLAGKPETAVLYWLDPDIQDVLKGREHSVILNIANEPFGNKASDQWFGFHVDAIQRLREAGYKHTLLVDAANWGQDWKETTLDRGNEVLAADVLKNTMFAVHMYEYYGTAEVVENYLKKAQEQGLCIIVGEFGMEHYGKPVAAEAILETCHDFQVGYLGWSWSGNNPETEHLDLVIDFDPAQLSPWGELLFNHPKYGIKATSKKADVFTNE